MLTPASIEEELNIITTVVYSWCADCWPFHPYDQSFDNCSDGEQSHQSCDCSSSVSSLLWTATAAGAVFSYTWVFWNFFFFLVLN